MIKLKHLALMHQNSPKGKTGTIVPAFGYDSGKASLHFCEGNIGDLRTLEKKESLETNVQGFPVAAGEGFEEKGRSALNFFICKSK